MAAPAHYIRSIHSSFSAHSPSSAWASATATAQYHLNHHNTHTHTHTPNPNSTPTHHHHHHPLNQPRHLPHTHSNQLVGAPGFTHTPSISTHNTHMYTHHLRDLTHSPSPAPQRASGAQGPTPPLGMVMTQQGQYIPGPTSSQQRKIPSRAPPSPPPTSRRRSASIRMPPSYKFDPFGDDPVLPVPALVAASSGGGGVMPLTSSSQANRANALSVPASSSPVGITETATTTVSAPEPEMEADISSAAPASSPVHNHPYTIHIPAAAPNDIKLYTPSPPRLSARAPSFTPSSSTPSLKAASTPASSRPAQSYPAPNLSKIVAGMLLNRVHGTKPMRRRMVPGSASAGRQYVKSCLSSVVSVEA